MAKEITEGEYRSGLLVADNQLSNELGDEYLARLDEEDAMRRGYVETIVNGIKILERIPFTIRIRGFKGK